MGKGIPVIVALAVIAVLVYVAWQAFVPTPIEEQSADTVAFTPLPGSPFPGDFVQRVTVSPLTEEVATPSPPSPAAGETAAPGTVTVSLDESGFSPATPRIKAGTTVVFVNNGQGPHWPASELHPTHQLLPGFDARRGLVTGETYEFTFPKVGEWKMHDHLVPNNTGVVIVE